MQTLRREIGNTADGTNVKINMNEWNRNTIHPFFFFILCLGVALPGKSEDNQSRDVETLSELCKVYRAHSMEAGA